MIKKLFWLKIKQTVEFSTNCLLYAMLALLVIVGLKAACLRSAAYETRSPYELTYQLNGTESDSNKAYQYYAYQPPNNPVDSAPFVHIVNNTPFPSVNGFMITGTGMKCVVDIAVQNQQQASTVTITGYSPSTTVYNFGRSGYRQLYRAVIYETDPEVTFLRVEYNGNIANYPLQVTICGYHIISDNTTDLQALNRERPFTNFWTSPVDQIVYNYDKVQNLVNEIDRLNGYIDGLSSVVTGDLGTPMAFVTLKFRNIDSVSTIDTSVFAFDDVFTSSDRGVFFSVEFYELIGTYCSEVLNLPTSTIIESFYITVLTDSQFWSGDTNIYLQRQSGLFSLNSNDTINFYGYVGHPYGTLDDFSNYHCMYSPNNMVISWQQGNIVSQYNGYVPNYFDSTVGSDGLDDTSDFSQYLINGYRFYFTVNSGTTVFSFINYPNTHTHEFFFSFGGFAYNSQIYQQGFADGSRNAYNKGYQVGYDTGFNTGTANKRAYGEQRYNDGITAALNNTNAYGFTGLFGAITQVPVNIFLAMFDFEILGTNIASFLFTIVTIVVVIAVLHLFFL